MEQKKIKAEELDLFLNSDKSKFHSITYMDNSRNSLAIYWSYFSKKYILSYKARIGGEDIELVNKAISRDNAIKYINLLFKANEELDYFYE